MTTSAPTIPAAPAPLTDAEIKTETANALAADLLERALQGPVDSLPLTLIQIADSGLIGKEHDLKEHLERLCRLGEELTSLLSQFYPACTSGGGRFLIKKCQTLTEVVDLYRQEQFWMRSESSTLIQSEKLIGDVFKFYHDVHFLMLSIDKAQPGYRVVARCQAPQRTPNPYEAIDHD
jgi:hypothetical protein